MKNLAFFLPGMLLLFIAVSTPDPIVLNPAETDSFTLQPADFHPDDEERSKWIHQPLGNIKKTEYFREEQDDASIVIRAESVQSASGLVIPIEADPKEFPILEWDWKIESVLEDGNLRKKDGDDYAARIYITFDLPTSDLSFGDRMRHRAIRIFSSFDVPTRATNYIWANKAEVGTIAPNPYTDWVQMIAVQSGNDLAGEWQKQKQNIYEDYKKAFDGEEPPKITGIQIMTDSDDTESSARAWYGEITIRKENGDKPTNR